jgi:hypothetical protein
MPEIYNYFVQADRSAEVMESALERWRDHAAMADGVGAEEKLGGATAQEKILAGIRAAAAARCCGGSVPWEQFFLEDQG